MPNAVLQAMNVLGLFHLADAADGRGDHRKARELRGMAEEAERRFRTLYAFPAVPVTSGGRRPDADTARRGR